MSRANTDLQQIQHLVVLIPLTVSNAVTVVAVVVILLSLDPVLTVLALGALPLLNVLGKRFSSRLHVPVMAMQRESAELATVVEEIGDRRPGGEGLRRRADPDRIDSPMRPMTCTGNRWRRPGSRATYLPAMELLPNLGLVAVLGYGGHQVIDGSLTLGLVRRLQRLRRVVDLAVAHARHDRRQTQRAVVSAAGGCTRCSPPSLTSPPSSTPGGVAGSARRSRPSGGSGSRRRIRLLGDRRTRPGWFPSSSSRSGPADRRPRRSDRQRQVHGGPPAPSLLRRRTGALSASTVWTSVDVDLAELRRVDRHRVRGHVPVQRHDRRQHRVRRSRRGTADAIERAARLAGAHEFIDAARRRATPPRSVSAATRPLGWSASASGHRPGRPRRSPGVDPRRRDIGGRPHQGARDPRRARRRR